MGDVDVAAADGAVSLPRFLVGREALTGGAVVLSGPQLHHLRARRLHAGSQVILADGKGTQRRGFVTAVDRHQAVIQVQDDVAAQRDSRLYLTIALGLLKRDKLDWAIEKTTELGVTELIVFTSERTVARGVGERRARWDRVARSAAEQCQRSTLPVITGPVPFEELLAGTRKGVRLLFWEEQASHDLEHVYRQESRPASVLATIGPEGGFSAAEAQHAVSAGFHVLGLAPRILRAETAAVAVATLCQFLWGDLGERA